MKLLALALMLLFTISPLLAVSAVPSASVVSAKPEAYGPPVPATPRLNLTDSQFRQITAAPLGLPVSLALTSSTTVGQIPPPPPSLASTPPPNWKTFYSCLNAKAVCVDISGPLTFFQGLPNSNTTTHYIFLKTGQYFYYNSVGSNFSASVITAKWGTLPFAVPLITNTVNSNASAVWWAFNYNLLGNIATVSVYLKEQISNGYVSQNLKQVIVYAFSAPATLNEVFINPLNLQTNYDSTKHQILFGRAGYDWSDSPSGAYNSATNTLSWSVGTSGVIDPATIGTSTINEAVAYNYNHNIAFAATRWWFPYQDGTNCVERSSTDGITWTVANTMSSNAQCAAGGGFHTFYDGLGHMYYLVVGGSGTAPVYGEFTLNSDGTITRVGSETAITTTNAVSTLGDITIDSGNPPFTCIQTNAAGVFHIETFSGTTAVTDFTLSTTQNGCALFPTGTSSQKIMIYCAYSSSTCKVVTWPGSGAWSSAVATTNTYSMLQTSCVNSGATVYCIGLDTTNGGINSFKCTYPCSSWTETSNAVESLTAGAEAVSLSLISGTFVAFYACQSTCQAGLTTNTIYHRTSTDFSTWSAKQADFASETIPSGTNYGKYVMTASMSTSSSSTTVGLGWIAGGSFNVRFGTVSLTVSDTLTLTVDNSGATATFALSGGGVSPTSVAGDGASKPITCNSGNPTVTITVPSDGANSRERFSGGTAQTFACNGAGHSYTYYNELQNTYQATPKAQTTWDSGLTAPNVVGTVAGTASITICSITLTGGGGAATCSGWGDYNRATVIGGSTIAGAPANSQWLRNGACSSSSTTGGNTINCDFYKQWTNTYQLTANGATTFDGGLSSVVVTGNSLGASAIVCTITVTGGIATVTCSGYIDNAATPTVPTTIGTPPTNSRWMNNCALGSVTTGGGTINCNEWKQWTNQFAYSVFGGGTPTAPTFTANSLGVSTPTTLPTTPAGIYVDAGSACTVANPTTGSTSTERWDTTTACPTTTGGGGSTTFVYYHQYAQAVSSSFLMATGQAPHTGVSSFSLSCTQFGVAVVLMTTSAVWLDAGTSCSQTSVVWHGLNVAGAALTVSSASPLQFITLIQTDSGDDFEFAVGSTTLSAVSFSTDTLILKFTASGSGTQQLVLEEIANAYKVQPGYLQVDSAKYLQNDPNWSFSGSTLTFSGLAIGSNAFQVSWAGQVGSSTPTTTPGGSVGGGGLPGIGPVNFYLALPLNNFTLSGSGRTLDLQLPLSWTNTNQITVTAVYLSGPYSGWAKLTTPLPLVAYTSPVNGSQTLLDFAVSVPSGTSPGLYQVTVTVTARSTSGSLSNLQKDLTFNVQQNSGQGLTAGSPDLYLYAAGAALALIVVVPSLRKK